MDLTYHRVKPLLLHQVARVQPGTPQKSEKQVPKTPVKKTPSKNRAGSRTQTPDARPSGGSTKTRLDGKDAEEAENVPPEETETVPAETLQVEDHYSEDHLAMVAELENQMAVPEEEPDFEDDELRVLFCQLAPRKESNTLCCSLIGPTVLNCIYLVYILFFICVKPEATPSRYTVAVKLEHGPGDMLAACLYYPWLGCR